MQTQKFFSEQSHGDLTSKVLSLKYFAPYSSICYPTHFQIKVYAVMEYDEESLQYINKHYFHAKTEGYID